MKLDLALCSQDVIWNPEEQKIQKMMTWVQNSRDVQVTGGRVKSERSGPDSGSELEAAGSFSAGHV